MVDKRVKVEIANCCGICHMLRDGISVSICEKNEEIMYDWLDPMELESRLFYVCPDFVRDLDV